MNWNSLHTNVKMAMKRMHVWNTENAQINLTMNNKERNLLQIDPVSQHSDYTEKNSFNFGQQKWAPWCLHSNSASKLSVYITVRLTPGYSGQSWHQATEALHYVVIHLYSWLCSFCPSRPPDNPYSVKKLKCVHFFFSHKSVTAHPISKLQWDHFKYWAFLTPGCTKVVFSDLFAVCQKGQTDCLLGVQARKWICLCANTVHELKYVIIDGEKNKNKKPRKNMMRWCIRRWQIYMVSGCALLVQCKQMWTKT